MMNNHIFEVASRIWFCGGYVEDGKYGNYSMFKVGDDNFVLMYKGDIIFQLASGAVAVDAGTTKAQKKAVYTCKVVLGLAE